MDNTKDAFLALVGDGKTHRETRETTLTYFDGISFGDCPQHLLFDHDDDFITSQSHPESLKYWAETASRSFVLARMVTVIFPV